MITEAEARQLLRTLQALWEELETAKYTPTPCENPTPPQPGPRYPGGAATTLDLDLTTRLKEITQDARNHIQPGRHLPADAPQLIRWLRFNLQAVLTLDFADDILDELQAQHRKLVTFLKPTYPQHSAGTCWNTASATLQILSINGHQHTRRDLYTWAARGHITRVKDDDGVYRYNAAQVLEYLTSRGELVAQLQRH